MEEKPPDPDGGPWGDGPDLIICFLPLVFLVIVTLSQRLRLPTVASLPLAAFMMWLIRLVYLSSPPNEVNAAVIFGMLDAFTPLSIITGAICLFSTMQHTQCLPWIVEKIKYLSGGQRVAEVFLIGWAFAYLIEGASGFGTPAALAAPMLVELGHSPFQSVICLLIMNTLATPFGAVGTPIWFGFGGLDISRDNLILLGFKVSVIDAIVAHIVPLIAASFLVSWREMWNSKGFVLLSIWSCIIPAVMLSYVSYEFSSILGGLVGVLITAFLAQHSIGLSRSKPVSQASDTILLQMAKCPELEDPAPPQLKTGSSGNSSIMQKPQLRRVNSIEVATLYMEPHLQRQESFESTPGEFYHALAIDKGCRKRAKNLVNFPITYDPLNYPNKKISRGIQTSSVDSEVSNAVEIAVGQESSHVITIPADDKTSSSARKERSPSSEFLIESYDAQKRKQPVNSDETQTQLEPMGSEHKSFIQSALRTFPLWGTILLLVVTRVPQLGARDLLRESDPNLKIDLGTLGEFRISAALVISILHILDEGISWSYQLLFVPFVLPFIVVSVITIALFRRDMAAGIKWWTPFYETIVRVKSIVVALMGALVLVALIRNGGNGSPAFIIGSVLADALKDGFIVISPLVGGLGSFFSGSTTVSNLTFGSVQEIAAIKMGRPVTSMLALQCAGATMGNMLCINNIISVKAVLGLPQSEGEFIKKTAPVAAVFYAISLLAGLVFIL